MPFLESNQGPGSDEESMCNFEEENETSKQTVFFSSSQTYELMHCLQELCLETELPIKQKLLLEENETRIRMKLARNLAVSLMMEGDISSNV